MTAVLHIGQREGVAVATDDVNDSRWWFGRLESKLDGLDEKLDHTAETMGRHEERLVATERDIREIKSDRAADRGAAAQHASSNRVGVKVAIITAGLGGIVSVVILLVQLLAHH